MREIKGTCQDCVFWQYEPADRPMQGGDGECRRRPPDTRVPRWPRTCRDDWCGELVLKDGKGP